MMFIEKASTEMVYQISTGDSMHYQTIRSSQGNIAFVDTGGTGFRVVFLHGNSCFSRVFQEQISSLRNRYRVIAIEIKSLRT